MAQQFKTVLIIEDDHDIRVTLRQVYEASGYYVFTVTNGHMALELLKLIPAPKLIVCDLRMPLMDGAAFIREKSKIEKLKDVPVIIISGQPGRFTEFSDIVCMPKPLDLFKLIHQSESFFRDPAES